MSQTPFERACSAVDGVVALSRLIGRSKQAVSHYRDRVPESMCPAIERVTGVTVEELRPDLKWIRVSDPAWPNGKPLLDVPIQKPKAAATLAPVTRQVGEPCTAIETEAAAGPVACDDPALVEARAVLGGERRNENEQYIGHGKKRAGDKPSSKPERSN